MNRKHSAVIIGFKLNSYIPQKTLQPQQTVYKCNTQNNTDLQSNCALEVQGHRTRVGGKTFKT